MRVICFLTIFLFHFSSICDAEAPRFADGVFIVHHPPGLQYSSSNDYCREVFSENMIIGCDSQNPRIDLDGNKDQSSVWYVLAAFSGSGTLSGYEFGFGNYDSRIYSFVDWGPCNTNNKFSITTTGWPGPNAGVSVGTTYGFQSEYIYPVYFFAGYAYQQGAIPLSSQPFRNKLGTFVTGTNGKSIFLEPEAVGTMGLFQDGVQVCPDSVTPDMSALTNHFNSMRNIRRMWASQDIPDSISLDRSIALKMLKLMEWRKRRGCSFQAIRWIKELESDPNLEFLITAEDKERSQLIIIDDNGFRCPNVNIRIRTQGHAIIRLYNSYGDHLFNLCDEWLEPGWHQIDWPEDLPPSQPLAEGAYLLELSVNSDVLGAQCLVVLL